MHPVIREIAVWELYLTGRGRLSRRDYGYYNFLPGIIIVCISLSFLFLSGVKYEGDQIYGSAPYLGMMAVLIPFTLIGYGKRARDFNAPFWVGLLPLMFLTFIVFLSIVAPETEPVMEKILDSTSGTIITAMFWAPKGTDGDNAYGPPCKVVWFKKRAVF